MGRVIPGEQRLTLLVGHCPSWPQLFLGKLLLVLVAVKPEDPPLDVHRVLASVARVAREVAYN